MSLPAALTGLVKNVPDEAKWSFSTRRVRHEDVAYMDSEFDKVRPGDLILARVERINQHRRVQLATGRPCELFIGDLLVMVCGARYAPDQFEGIACIDTHGADLLAGGGCIGHMRSRNDRVKPPTRLIPVGRLLNSSRNTINLADYAIPRHQDSGKTPVIAVVGTAMNSGKTLASARLSLGLRRAGWRVGAIKATGTGAFGDFNGYQDAGAHYVADFTDAGMVTTYLEPLHRIKDGMRDLLGSAEHHECNIVVMEIADGLLQRETAMLLEDTWFTQRISGLLFACSDALAAAGGVKELHSKGLTPHALTGILSCSPMSAHEAEQATHIPVLRKEQLADPAEATALVTQATALPAAQPRTDEQPL